MLLALRELYNQHSDVNIEDLVLNVLMDFRILNKIGYFIIDNIKSNNNLIKYIAEILNIDSGVQYDF